MSNFAKNADGEDFCPVDTDSFKLKSLDFSTEVALTYNSADDLLEVDATTISSPIGLETWNNQAISFQAMGGASYESAPFSIDFVCGLSSTTITPPSFPSYEISGVLPDFIYLFKENLEILSTIPTNPNPLC